MARLTFIKSHRTNQKENRCYFRPAIRFFKTPTDDVTSAASTCCVTAARGLKQNDCLFIATEHVASHFSLFSSSQNLLQKEDGHKEEEEEEKRPYLVLHCTPLRLPLSIFLNKRSQMDSPLHCRKIVCWAVATSLTANKKIKKKRIKTLITTTKNTL